MHDLVIWAVGCVMLVGLCAVAGAAQTQVRAEVFRVVEIEFAGPEFGPKDRPAVEVELSAEFLHEGGTQYRVEGFWDGDGKGGSRGAVFKMRVCPTMAGRWTLRNVRSNRPELDGQNEGQVIVAEDAGNKGFWRAGGAGNRWWVRDDGSHPYIVGNTHYVLLSRPNGKEATVDSIRSDIAANARYFNKLRMLMKAFPAGNGSAEASAFLTPAGEPTNDEGDDADEVRPNPAFYHRVDAAVQAGFEKDLIIDLILGTTAHNKEKMARTKTYLRYIAARYGAYPNVWLTLANEYSDQYDAAKVVEIGSTLRELLPYPTPMSIHDWHGPWKPAINGAWCTHSIRQGKMPKHKEASDTYLCADGMMQDYGSNLGKPTMNDENGYYGEEASAEDVMEGVLGTFIGGGYGTTGYRTTGITKGPYYWGFSAAGEDIAAHPVTDMLRFFRERIDANVRFWEMTPVGEPSKSIFEGASEKFRAMEATGEQYLLASDAAADTVTAQLPEGFWRVVQWDLIRKTETVLAGDARAPFRFSTPESRAALTFFTRVAD